MKGRISSLSRPSPAMIVAMIALFAALGGSAIALEGRNTVNSGDVINDTLKSKDLKNGLGVRTQDVVDGSLTGADVAADSLTGGNIDESTLGQVPSASNADNLGGVPAGSYQRECVNGAIKGYALVNGSAAFPAAYTSTAPQVAEGFNCNGLAAQARRIAQGIYNVCFVNNFPRVIYATGIGPGTGEDNLVTWARVADGGCPGGVAAQISIVDEGGDDTVDRQDDSFSVLLG